MITGVLFDLDGTLVTLEIDGAALRSRMIKELENAGVDTSGLDSSSAPTQAIIDFGMSSVRARGGDERRLRAHLYSVLDELELGWGTNSAPMTGAVEALQQLRDDGVKIATVTNSGRSPASDLLERHGLRRYLDAVVTRDDVEAMKPSPEGIIKALGQIGVGRGCALYVGDSWVDVRAARAAEVRIASIVSGQYSEERLRAEGPDLVLHSLAELPSAVARDSAMGPRLGVA